MPRLSVWFLRTSLLHLGVGFTLGGLMLWNKGLLIDVRLWLLLPAHMEVLLIGWTLQLAMGVTLWILPRFTREPRYGNLRLGWLAFGLLNAGVISVALSQWLGNTTTLVLAGRLMEVFAAMAFVGVIWPRVKPFGSA